MSVFHTGNAGSNPAGDTKVTTPNPARGDRVVWMRKAHLNKKGPSFGDVVQRQDFRFASEKWEFESPRLHQFCTRSSTGRAFGYGPKGCGFDPLRVRHVCSRTTTPLGITRWVECENVTVAGARRYSAFLPFKLN
jgi:hypothetical protein